jgi:hypothetical protein
MAVTEWVTVKAKWCDVIQTNARLEEKWVYPSGNLPDIPAYRVAGRRCSHALDCNLLGCHCVWAFSEIGDDPFDGVSR